jgi:hypothetical protein
MNRGFVRAIWGNVSLHREGKIAKEIAEVKDKDWFTVYTFGSENHKWLSGLGFKTVMISSSPVLYDMESELYRHKLDVFAHAATNFDEFVFIDWDCFPVASLADVWEALNKKESFQANLYQYRTKKCLWRTDEPRKVCNGGFVYFRDKTIPDKLIKNWESLSEWVNAQRAKRQERGKDLRFRERSLIFDDEPSMSKYIDDICGGWKGESHYWEHFEPGVCNLRRKSVYPKEKTEAKRACFIHNI